MCPDKFYWLILLEQKEGKEPVYYVQLAETVENAVTFLLRKLQKEGLEIHNIVVEDPLSKRTFIRYRGYNLDGDKTFWPKSGLDTVQLGWKQLDVKYKVEI